MPFTLQSIQFRSREAGGTSTEQIELVAAPERLFQGTLTLAASAAANTLISTADITLPADSPGRQLYLVSVYNPSASFLTVRFENKRTFNTGSTLRYAELGRAAVPNAEVRDFLVEGLGGIAIATDTGGRMRITVSNDSANGGTPFSIDVIVTKIA